MKAIAIIPMRGGSQRIPRKNIRPFFGKPIFQYSVDAARECGLFDDIVVSTEDEEIGHMVNDYGVDWIRRPDELSVDRVGTQEVARDALMQLRLDEHEHDFSHACVIYATAPLMLPVDLARGLAALHESRKAFSYSASEFDAGQFYWGHTWAFIGRVPLYDHSTRVIIDYRRVCDINTEDDLKKAESMYTALYREMIPSVEGE